MSVSRVIRSICADVVRVGLVMEPLLRSYRGMIYERCLKPRVRSELRLVRFSLIRWVWETTGYDDDLTKTVAAVGRLFVLAVFWLSGFLFVASIVGAVFAPDSLNGWGFFAGAMALLAVVAGWQLLRNRPNPLVIGIIGVAVVVPMVPLLSPALGVGVLIATVSLGTTVALMVKPRTAVTYLVFLSLVFLVVLVLMILIHPSGLDVALGVAAAVPSILIAGLVYDLVARRSRFNEERLEQVISNAADAIIGIDRGGRSLCSTKQPKPCSDTTRQERSACRLRC